MKRTRTYTAEDIRHGDEYYKMPDDFELVPASDYDALAAELEKWKREAYKTSAEHHELTDEWEFEALIEEIFADRPTNYEYNTVVEKFSEYVFERDALTAELARVKAESLRVVKVGGPCSLFELESSGCHLFRHVTGGPVYIMDTMIKGRSNTDSGRAHWCAKLNGVTKEWAQYDDYAPIQPVRLERWENSNEH